MPFPLSIRGSISISGAAANVSDDAIIIACVDQLEHEGARVVSRGDGSLSFVVPFFGLGYSWRFTAPLSAGSLEIAREAGPGRRLTYDFSTRRLTLMGTAMMGGLLAFDAFKGFGELPWEVPVVGWLWLVGANYSLTYARAESWVRGRVTEAVKASAALATAAHKA